MGACWPAGSRVKPSCLALAEGTILPTLPLCTTLKPFSSSTETNTL